MGDGDKTPLRLQFNPKVRLEFHGATITSDAGLLPIRELDDALGLTHIAADYLQESRSGRNIRHHLVPLLRQSIYSRLAGYDDTNDAERLSQDPAMRVVVGWQGSDRNAASTNTVSRFETETLTQQDNLQGLARMNPQWVEDAMAHTPHQRVILDMDSSESPVHGHQEGAAYNGHFECVCYHPLFLFNQFGDCEGATLRPGNVHSAEGWQELLEPVVKRYQRKGRRLLFRGDAAFGKPEVYEYLEQEMIGYAIRLFAFHAYSVGRGRRTSLFVGLVATATAAAATLTTEAIAAVDGPVAAGQERYGCLIAAFGANHGVHLAGTTV